MTVIDVNERHLAYILNRAARLQNEGHLETQGSLSKLHRISVTYHDTENGLDIPEVLPFMKLKSVKKLFGNKNFNHLSNFDFVS
jgi:hypothetical protein